MDTLYTRNNWGSAKLKADKTLEIRSERSPEGAAHLISGEIESLKNQIMGSDTKPIKTQYFFITIHFADENVTLTWPSEAGEEKATFLKEKLLTYLS